MAQLGIKFWKCLQQSTNLWYCGRVTIIPPNPPFPQQLHHPVFMLGNNVAQHMPWGIYLLKFHVNVFLASEVQFTEVWNVYLHVNYHSLSRGIPWILLKHADDKHTVYLLKLLNNHQVKYNYPLSGVHRSHLQCPSIYWATSFLSLAPALVESERKDWRQGVHQRKHKREKIVRPGKKRRARKKKTMWRGYRRQGQQTNEMLVRKGEA